MRLKPLKTVKYSDPVKVLKAAMRLLSNKNRWTKGYYARNAMNLGVNADDHYAVKFCAAGACRRYSDMSGAVSFLDKATASHDVTQINDARKTSHAKILRKFRHAIRLAEKEKQQ